MPHGAAPSTSGPPTTVPAGILQRPAVDAGQLCREHTSSGKMQLLAAAAGVQLVGRALCGERLALVQDGEISRELCGVLLSGKTECCVPSH